VLASRFRQWVATTAKTDGERAKLPALILNPGAPVWVACAASIRSLCTCSDDGGIDPGDRVGFIAKFG
jgi:hypothetical protein